MISFFWQKGFYFNGQLFFYSGALLKQLKLNFGLNLFFLKMYFLRLEDFENFNITSILNKTNLSLNIKFSQLTTIEQFLFNSFLINFFPVFLSIKKQLKFNILRFYLLRTNRGLSLFFNKPISRRSRNKTFLKSTPKAHLRKRVNTSLWFKILINYYLLLINYKKYLKNLIFFSLILFKPLLFKQRNFIINLNFKNKLISYTSTTVFYLFNQNSKIFSNLKMFKFFCQKQRLNYSPTTYYNSNITKFRINTIFILNTILNNLSKPNEITTFNKKINFFFKFVLNNSFKPKTNEKKKLKINSINTNLNILKIEKKNNSSNSQYWITNIFIKHMTYYNQVKLLNYSILKFREFRLLQSEIFFLTPFKKQVLNYNLLNIEDLSSTLTSTSNTFFFSNKETLISIFSYFDFFLFFFNNNAINHQYTNSLEIAFNNKFSLLDKAAKRIKLIWVSKVTQLMLDPYRREFMMMYRKPFKYQKRITNYIFKYYRFKVLEFMTLLEYQLLTFLVRIKFAVNKNFSYNLLTKKFVYINGLVINSIDYQVQFFDVIQLILNYRFLIYKKWLVIFEQKRFYKFFYLVKYWRIRSFRPFPKQSSYRIPEWVKHSIFFSETKPYFLEINFFSMTCILLKFNFLNYNFYSYFSYFQIPIASVRAYNWKTLT